jgi:hypothetical protein
MSFSKNFEKVIYHRIYHINHNHILGIEQCGFRHASSTDIMSYNWTENVLRALNNKLLVGGIFYDLHTAFDCVNYDILLSKMEFYGISGKANNLIKSFLQDRRQRKMVDYDSKNITLNGILLQMDFTGIHTWALLFLLYVKVWGTVFKCH